MNIMAMIVFAFYLFLFVLVIAASIPVLTESDLYNKRCDKLIEELEKINKQK